MTQNGSIKKYIDKAGAFRATFVEASGPLIEMQNIQKLLPAATILVGRAGLGAALLASQLDESEVLSLYFRGQGPIEYIFSECSSDGKLRAYTPDPTVAPFANGEMRLGAALGKGTLTVVRTHPKKAQPHRGTIELKTGEIGEDIAHYLHQSEQRKALVNLAVKLDGNGQVLTAGGLLIELLPNAPEEAAFLLETNWMLSEKLTEMLENKMSVDQIMTKFTDGFDLKAIDHPPELIFECPCSLDRLIRSMRMFSESDLDEIVQKKETTKAQCEFCGKQYALDWTIVKEIRSGRHKIKLH